MRFRFGHRSHGFNSCLRFKTSRRHLIGVSSLGDHTCSACVIKHLGSAEVFFIFLDLVFYRCPCGARASLCMSGAHAEVYACSACVDKSNTKDNNKTSRAELARLVTHGVCYVFAKEDCVSSLNAGVILTIPLVRAESHAWAC
jgi:hypothetical protein